MNKHERNIESYLKQFTNQDHKQQINEFLRLRRTIDTNSKGEKISPATISSDVHAILQLSMFLKKPFNKASQDDMMEFDGWLRKKFEDNSATMIEQKIKRFYKFVSDPATYKKGKQLQKTIKFPECVEWMSTVRNSKELPLDSILTEKQIKKMLDKCKDVRQQVIICSLIDGGLRVSELTALKIKNIHFDRQLGAYFILPKKATGLKTGQRKIQLFIIPSSTLYIRNYLNQFHKFKNNPDAPFIYSDAPQLKDRKPENLFVTPCGIWTIVKQITQDCDIKDIHPHTLRHISATFCAMRGFNEAMMRERFGWSNSSTMPSYYTHLASKDTSDYIKKLLGIKDDEPKETMLQPIICWNCQTENPPTFIHCGKCSATLKPKKEEITPTAIDTGIATQEALKDPSFREFYNDMLAKTWEMYKEAKEKK